jgi:uncharacterized lipoprotein YddW (UPF0748 family)
VPEAWARQTGELRRDGEECQVTTPYRVGRHARVNAKPRDRGDWGRPLRALSVALALPVLSAPCADVTALAAPARRTSAPGPIVEARAIWVNRFEYKSPADIVQIIDKAASSNFNIVYFQVRGQGDAYYRSDLEPCAIRICGKLGDGAPPYDPLEIAIREAHGRGIELHAWLNALPGWASPRAKNAAFCALLVESRRGSPRHMLLAHPEWVMSLRDGTPMDCFTSQETEYAYVSPGIPAVRTHLARVAADVVRRYAVDGIHLDRIRYPGPSWSYDEPSLAAFRTRTGRAPALGNDPEWDAFRREQINATVRAVFDSVTAVRPTVVLSAATWPIHDRATFGWPSSSSVSQFFQDARAWAAGGYVDVVAPMTYHQINERYCSYALPGGRTNPDWACLLDDHQAGVQSTGAQLYMGLWADLGAAELGRQVRLGREKRVHGFAVYSYGAANAAGLLEALRDSVFTEKAQVPPMLRQGPHP